MRIYCDQMKKLLEENKDFHKLAYKNGVFSFECFRYKNTSFVIDVPHFFILSNDSEDLQNIPFTDNKLTISDEYEYFRRYQLEEFLELAPPDLQNFIVFNLEILRAPKWK